ncbi:nucleoside-diphosphate kinase [Candidatus Woesearchaeota archaeon]|jgi:nucleoside-diphosphate kinase|nr:nucleoside-diphosphate kinase [Candidatus Woesearchaeota archaeon]MBT4114030.1 nucleoside-diphosphate kinase [Candidatus Woesearchaeota archaeon]MBT4248113.1 nucleoside-diphosphate kinase [Candidatus Woesearchaeota archaeon]
MKEQTLVLVKPDGVERGLIGEVIKRLEQKGLTISAMKMLTPTSEQVGTHYPYDLDWLNSVGINTKKSFAAKGVEMEETELQIGERIRQWNMDLLSSGPIVAMIVNGYHAVEIARKVAGATQPLKAQLGTIRGDFCVESYDVADVKKRPIKNIMHTAESVDAAKNEMQVWFPNF